MPFTSGQPPYRNGAWPLGSRNKRTTEAIEAIIAAGYQDPLLTLAELQAKSADEGIRATAANMLAPFLHSKCGPMPPFRFIIEPIELPHAHPTSPQEVDANIAHIIQARRSLALRPAHSRGHQFVTRYPKAQTFRLLHACSGRFQLERSPGGACTHWKSAALSRRTWRAVILCTREPLQKPAAVIVV
jgi:hypothetical protein